MVFVTTKDRDRINREIVRAETKTSGEIVAVICASSDDYIFIPLLWAALAALAVPLALFPFSDLHFGHIYAAQLVVFAILSLISQWRPLRVALVPRRIKRARAHRHATEQFLAQNLHTTKGRTGVLIFVSVAEHFAEVIADEEIYRKVPPETWSGVVDELTRHIGKRRVADGFVSAIKMCADVLAKIIFHPAQEMKMNFPTGLLSLSRT